MLYWHLHYHLVPSIEKTVPYWHLNYLTVPSIEKTVPYRNFDVTIENTVRALLAFNLSHCV